MSRLITETEEDNLIEKFIKSKTLTKDLLYGYISIIREFLSSITNDNIYFAEVDKSDISQLKIDKNPWVNIVCKEPECDGVWGLKKNFACEHFNE